MILSDSELVEMLRVPRTRREGFAVLVKQYSEKLYWKVRRIVLSHEDANDVLQNVFIKVWSNLQNFQGKSSLSTWLYRIATNETLSFLSQKKARMMNSFEDVEELMLQNLQADTYFEGDEVQLKLQKAIITLPEKQRLVFNMRFYDEMPYEEMSKILDTSVGALKASYHHAARKVEDFLIKE